MFVTSQEQGGPTQRRVVQEPGQLWIGRLLRQEVNNVERSRIARGALQAREASAGLKDAAIQTSEDVQSMSRTLSQLLNYHHVHRQASSTLVLRQPCTA